MLCLLLSAAPILAQDGTVAGTITAQDGSALPGVQVTATNNASGQEESAFTDSQGRYEITGLSGGPYRLSTSLEGFADQGRSFDLARGATVEQDFELALGALEETMTVTAAKGERALEEIPQQVTVITSEEIASRQVESVQRAVERAPNVRTIDPNPARARPQLRGLSSSRVLILIDGERLNNVRFDAGATGISPGMIDVGEVETIEVLGGAGSSLYGTDAMAGVINIVTKQSSRPSSGQDLDLGLDLIFNENSGYTRGLLSANYATPKFSMRASYSQFELDGWEAGDGSVSLSQVLDAAQFAQAVASSAGSNVVTSFAVWDFAEGEEVTNAIGDGQNASLDLAFFPSQSQTFRLRYVLSDHSDLGLPFSIPPFDPTERFNSFRDFNRLTAEWELAYPTEWLSRIFVRAYTQTFERPQDDRRFNIDIGSSWTVDSTGSQVFTGNRSTFTRGRDQATLNTVDSTGLQAFATFIPWKNALVTTGLSYLQDESEDQFSFRTFDATGNVTTDQSGLATTPDTEYENLAWFTTLEWNAASWLRLSGGVRWDNWETTAKPTPGYPPGPESYLVSAAFPQIAANPGSVQVEGINGVDELVNGTSTIGTDNDVWTSNVGATFPLPGGINPFVRWGESYREPEVTVRYLIRNFGPPFISISGLPNTALEPEEGETLDYGIKVRRNNWRGSLTFFENDLTNFIGSVFSSTYFIGARPDLGLLPSFGTPFHAVQFFQRVNFSDVEVEGWELTFQASLPLGDRGSLTPYLNLGETETRLLTPDARRLGIVQQWFNRNDTPVRFEGSANDVPFGDTIPFQGLFGVRYTPASGRWFAEYELRWVDEINRVDPDSLRSPNITQFGSITSLDGYERHTVRGGYNLERGAVPVRLTLGIENLTDEFYFEPFQLNPAAGRSFVLGASFRFNDLLP